MTPQRVHQPSPKPTPYDYTDPIAEVLSQPMMDPRWFALGALFSLFSLAAITTGDPNWLGFLSFLGFLVFLYRGNAEGRSTGRR
jgi:hypothetical protein